MGDSSRRSYSRRDTTPHSSRGSSSRSSRLDAVQHSNTGYNRSYSTLDASGQGGSSGGYNRSYNTYDTPQSSTGYPEQQTNYSSVHGRHISEYDRSYNTVRAMQDRSGNPSYSNVAEHTITEHAEWSADSDAGQGSSDRVYTTYDALRERSNTSQEGQSSAGYTKRSTSYAGSFMGFLTRKLGWSSKSHRGERTEQVRSDKSLQVPLDRDTDKGRSFLQTIKPLEGDTTAIFEKRYTNTILRGGDPSLPYPFNMTVKPGDIYTATFVTGHENLLGSYFYRSTINPKSAEIDAHTMYRDRDKKFTVEGTSPLPASEILWHQYRMAVSNYGLPETPSRIKFSTIQNTETEKTLGPHFKDGTSETVFEGDEKYATIASTPIGKIPFYLTKKYYSDSKISKIEVTKRNEAGNFGDITFYIEDKEDSDSKET
jgi:hypothetical protein